MKNVYDSLVEVFGNGGTTALLRLTAKMLPNDRRTNLPTYASGSVKDEKVWVEPWKKGDNYFHELISTPAMANRLSCSLLESVRQGAVDYPNLDIVYTKDRMAGLKTNLLEESHRLFAAYLSGKMKSEIHVQYEENGERKPFFNLIKDIYDVDEKKRYLTCLKYSPLTILFGGMGSWVNLVSPIKMTRCVEAECVGRGEKQLAFRKNVGGYKPVVAIRSGEEKDGELTKKASQLGHDNVIFDPREYVGAAVIHDADMDYSIHLGRISAVVVDDNKEINAKVRAYLTALAIRVFFVGNKYKPYTAAYSGRTFTVNGVVKELIVPSPDVVSKEEKVFYGKIEPLLVGLNLDTSKELYDIARKEVGDMVLSKSMTLYPSPKMEEEANKCYEKKEKPKKEKK